MDSGLGHGALQDLIAVLLARRPWPEPGRRCSLPGCTTRRTLAFTVRRRQHAPRRDRDHAAHRGKREPEAGERQTPGLNEQLRGEVIGIGSALGSLTGGRRGRGRCGAAASRCRRRSRPDRPNRTRRSDEEAIGPRPRGRQALRRIPLGDVGGQGHPRAWLGTMTGVRRPQPLSASPAWQRRAAPPRTGLNAAQRSPGPASPPSARCHAGWRIPSSS